jgi:hypothetical protein
MKEEEEDDESEWSFCLNCHESRLGWHGCFKRREESILFFSCHKIVAFLVDKDVCWEKKTWKRDVGHDFFIRLHADKRKFVWLDFWKSLTTTGRCLCGGGGIGEKKHTSFLSLFSPHFHTSVDCDFIKTTGIGENDLEVVDKQENAPPC